jgi:hypothetical protein
MRWLLRYISTHDFRPFGIYRIVVGLLIVVVVVSGRALQSLERFQSVRAARP